MAHFPETRLQELRIGLAMLALDTSFLGPLLVRSPRLRALSLALSSRGVPQGLAMVVRDHCPELTRLAVKHHGTEDKTTELLLGAFEHGLERLTVQCRTIDPSSFVAAMTAPQMLHRLTSLCIRASLTPMAMATLAQQCCHLTELQANVLAPEFDNEKATHSSPWPGDELDHVWLEDDLSGLERIQWGCTKLRRLNLQMLHPGTFGWNASEDNGLLDRFEDYFLVQIGNLTALQELTLSRPGHRRHGLDGLKRLDRLRALKVVDVRIAFAKLGVDEAKWIASHWGSLIEIRIPADAADVLQEWKPWIQCLDRPLS
ncbi:hypothetical protein BGZ74_007743 [Mortierella antarctica]|nr:hypothetical protein BGZ74_007743 [Mortierella antarctica]